MRRSVDRSYLSRESVPRGELHHSAKLTVQKVQALRALHGQHGLLIRCGAKLADVSYGAVWDVVHYNTWRHVRDVELNIDEALKLVRQRGR